MADLRKSTHKVVEITLDIPIKTTPIAAAGNKLTVDVSVDVGRAKRFLRKLTRLCKRYGYDITTDAPTDGGGK